MYTGEQAVYSLSGFYGTYLQSKVKGYDRLVDRITWSLGYPMINLEVHRNQLNEFITIAAEMFTKYAGYTEEYLVFDSNLYEQGKGIRLDKLFSITPELNNAYQAVDLTISENNTRSVTTSMTNNVSAIMYQLIINDEDDDPTEYVIKYTDTTTKHSRVGKVILTTRFLSGAGSVTYSEYGVLHTSTADLLNISVAVSGTSGQYVNIIGKPTATGTATVIANDFVSATQGLTAQQNNLAGYDTLIENYRQVIDVYSFDEGSSASINTLFTIEQTLAQQTYFSYAMGNYGFDLTSWYTVKQFLEVRERMLTIKKAFKFNQETQYLTMYPGPLSSSPRFYGVIACYVEKPLLDILKEPWVYQYSLALTKIGIARVRGKYGGVNLFGGGSPNYNELLSEGLQEKKELETALYEGTPGLGDAPLPQFFIG